MSKILIVDDDPINIAIMEEILSEDYTTVTAMDGVEALAKVSSEHPDLILLDIMMPKLNGYEVCKQVKRSPIANTTHVILISAKASKQERLEGYQAGADDYVVKPFDEDELRAKVTVQLRLRATNFELAKARAALKADNRELERLLEESSRELVATRDLIVFSLAKLAESRDPETGAHLERIRTYSDLIAEELSENSIYSGQIDKTFRHNLYLATPLHDIGKVGIPDAVLLKPGKLTEEEFKVMKTHTLIGANALAESADRVTNRGFLDMAMQIARSHHEKWNGKGYPDQLAAENIPLAARITAVADVFDALTSVRVYKDAMPREKARDIIVNDAGTHFDPHVVDAFISRIQDVYRIHERLGETTLPEEEEVKVGVA